MREHFRNVLRACVDLELYRDVYRQPRSRSIVYLLVLVAIAAWAATISLTLKVRRVVRERVIPEVEMLPTVIIRNGVASANVEQPWSKRIARNDRGSDLVLIIDTTGRRDDFAANEVGVFLKKTEVLVKDDDGEVHPFPLDEVEYFELGPPEIKRWIARALFWLPLVLAGLTAWWFSLAKTLQVLALAFMMRIATRTRQHALTAHQSFTIAAYALTPAVLLEALAHFVPIVSLSWFAIYLSVAVTWALRAARAVPDEPPAG